MGKVAVVDNYDSFTYNLVQYVGELGAEVVVYRHDEITPEGLMEIGPSHLIISPGPKTPVDAGISMAAVRLFAGKTPVLGVCLGHQAIGAAYGATISRGREPVHGKTSDITHDGKTIFAGLDSPMLATRYHSLIVESELPPELEVSAWSDGDVVMGLRHRELPIEGVQFHPESILTHDGKALLANFLKMSISETVPSPVISAAIDRLLAGEDLGRADAAAALEVVLAGDAGDAQTAGFLIALRAKGESAEELAGLASVIRAKAQAVSPSVGDTIDTCGTGGGRNTFNISTTTAFVVAGAGVPVTKHGNRSATSKSGSADVLEAMGANIDLAPDAVAQCLDESGFCFMFAPLHHPAFKHVVPVRQALAVRTIFNLLGPLTNPAGAKRQLIGISDPNYLDRIAEALAGLDCEKGMIVHGRDGMDELSTAAINDVAIIEAGSVRREEIDPTALGFSAPAEGALAGGEPDENAKVTHDVLTGRNGPARDIVILNAGAALVVAGAADSIEAGLAAAVASIDSGAAAERLRSYVDASNRLGA